MRVAGPVLQPLDPRDDSALLAWYDAMQRGQRHGRVQPLVSSYPEVAAMLRELNKRQKYVLYGLYERDTVLGTLLLGFPRAENTHLVEFELTVPPEHRGNGHGATLLGHAERLARAEGRSTMYTEVCAPCGGESPGTRFASRHGYHSVLHEDRFLLPLPMNEGVLARIENAAGVKQRGYRFASWLGACPVEHLHAYAGLRTAMEADEPLGELDYQPETWDAERVRETELRLAKQGEHLITTIALRDGEAVGYSALLVLKHDPGQVSQEDTLVSRAHRGHRLGDTLKARNLRMLAEHFPRQRYVHTWMADTNSGMRHINAAFGFYPVEESRAVQRTTPTHAGDRVSS